MRHRRHRRQECIRMFGGKHHVGVFCKVFPVYCDSTNARVHVSMLFWVRNGSRLLTRLSLAIDNHGR